MARAAQIYDFNLAANQSVELLVEGGFYKLTAASGNVKVTREGGSSINPLLPGQGERLTFKRLTIQDTSGEANTVSILVADESFVDTRIYGNVQVIDGGRLLTMTDAAYVATSTTNPSVGNYAMHQLWNPAGNTKWAAVSRVIVSNSGANTAIQLRPHNVALATLGNIAQPKKIDTGFSNSTMQNRSDLAAAIVGGSVIGFFWASPSAPYVFEFKEPIVIKPGQGLISAQANTNTALATNFDFYEFTP